MIRKNVKKPDAVLLKQTQKDHETGLEDNKAYALKKKKTMEIYCNELTQQAIIREFPYIFTEQKYPGIP